MKLAILKERRAGEARVAATPDTVKKLKALGLDIAVETSAGAGARIADADYTAAGASIAPDAAGALEKDAIAGLAAQGITAFAIEFIPRISRAQAMDALSSQANLAGYKAVIDAAAGFGRPFPMMMTAAGTSAPARAFIMGVGVAGLQAIATARRLGAIVSATDV